MDTNCLDLCSLISLSEVNYEEYIDFDAEPLHVHTYLVLKENEKNLVADYPTLCRSAVRPEVFPNNIFFIFEVRTRDL